MAHPRLESTMRFPFFLFVLANANAADPQAPAQIVVSNQVIRQGIEPIGVNLTTIAGGTNFATNNFIFGSGFEPAIVRYLVRVDEIGGDWFAFNSDAEGVHMWEQNATGFGNGAKLWFYRVVDGGGQPLPFTGGLSDETGAHHVVLVGESVVPMPNGQLPLGGWIAEGEQGSNRVYMDPVLPLAFGDYAYIEVRKTRLLASEVHPRLHPWFQDQVNHLRLPNGWQADLVPHPGVLPGGFSDGGETCLMVTATSGGDWIGQYLFHALDDQEGQWYSQLEPGASYRVVLWMRQVGLPGGSVRFISSGDYAGISQSTPWLVTDQWQQFSYDFTGPAYPLLDPFHQFLGLEFSGPGSLWLDNLVVYRLDNAVGGQPYMPHQLSFDELLSAFPASGSKPAIRFYPTLYPGYSDLDHLLAAHPNSSLDFIYNVGASRAVMTLSQCLEWAYATGSEAATRVVPFLSLSEEYLPQEWLGIVEYLGVPYDPLSDSPTSKPWAYRRFQQRGISTPWTDEFREIVLEMGNETWHNGAGGFGWHGFGAPQWVFDGGVEYGLFFRYIFQDHIAATPAWTTYNLEQKIRFCLGADYNGSAQGYGETAAQSAGPIASYIGHANYVGPTWETGDIPLATFDDHGMQETLVGFYTGMKELVDAAATTRDALAGSGSASYQILAYEGGASGYALPGSATPEQVEISELYGKSLGMAVSVLDCWLHSSLMGYLHQSNFAFASGSHWSSHTMPRAGGFRRHPSWLAMMLRNRYAQGSAMLQTTFAKVPTYERSFVDIPLISAYALQDEDSTSLFILSRKLDGLHDGVDFGDGSTAVSVTLPFQQVSSIDLYRLASPDGTPADPRSNNRQSEQVVLLHQTIDGQSFANPFVINAASGGVAGGMPPGTVFLYVFHHDNCLLGQLEDWPAQLTVLDLLSCLARP